MRRTIGILLFGTLTVTIALPVTSNATGPHTRATAKPKRDVATLDQFVAKAAGRNLAGLELSDLALQRSESAAVRRLATRAKAEHANTFGTLSALATGAGLTAAPPETMDLEQRGVKNRLAALSGKDFDRAYVDALRTNDERDIALYRSFTRDTKDEAVKLWVADQLTTIRKRRQLIDAATLEVRQTP